MEVEMKKRVGSGMNLKVESEEWSPWKMKH